MPRPPLPPVPPALRWGSSLGALAIIAGAIAFPAKLGVSPKARSDKPVPVAFASDIVWLPPGALTSDAAKAFPGQKKRPCHPKVQVEWDGVCWIPHRSAPPCPEGTFEGGGQCLVPVAPAPKPNTSMGP